MSTRDRIIKAALAAFSEHGFDGASTRDIASRAEANQGMIRHYFGGKEELWKTSVQKLLDDLDQKIAGMMEVLSPLDEKTRSTLLIRQFVLYSGRNPELHRIIMHESASDNPRSQWLMNEGIGPRMQGLVGMIHQKSGKPIEGIVHHVFAFVGAATHLFSVAPTIQRLFGFDPLSEEAIERHADILADILRKALPDSESS